MRILFPVTNRVHLARQQKLLDELQKSFDVHVEKHLLNYKDILNAVASSANHFRALLNAERFDLVLIRGDRFEMMPIAMMAVYRGIPIAHIEGGAESGAHVIDTKIRDAITQLADIHFVTDERAERRVIMLGASPRSVFNVGSLDVSFANSVEPKRVKTDGDYVVIAHHAIPGEHTETIAEAVEAATDLEIVGIQSNLDYAHSLFHEEYSPEDFINLLRYAKCFVSNSSAACKEASILGVPVVLTGIRQEGRLAGHNAFRVSHNAEEIKRAVRYQIEHGPYEPDTVYFREDTERYIKEILNNYYHGN